MKKNFKWIRVLTAVTAASFVLTGAGFCVLAQDVPADAEADAAVQDFDMDGAVEIVLENDTFTASSDGAELTEEQLEELEIKLKDETLKIKKAGTYVLSGSLNGSIEISADKEDQVNLILSGLTVECEADSALSVKKTGTLNIYLADDTDNILTSGTAADINEESAAATAEASGGVLYSKAVTVISGTGSLTVNGYINNGIQVTKNLTVESGSINVNAVNNGMKIKDTYTQNGGEVNVLSGSDGVKAQNEAQEAVEEIIDETTGEVIQEAQDAEEEAGTVIINGGSLNIDCYGDALYAKLDLVINDGTVNIKTEGEYPIKSEFGFGGGPGDSEGREGERPEGESAEGQRPEGEFQGQEGAQPQGESDEGPAEGQAPEGERPEGESAEGQAPEGERPEGDSQGQAAEDDTVSEKGLKSDGTLTINAGTIVIDSVDDAVHCADKLLINGGDITISAGDDGIHSDTELIINDGKVNILTAYEGIESNQITIAGGDVSVIANDDGVNASGGGDSFGGPGDSRQEAADGAEAADDAQDEDNTSSEMPNFNITGGNIYVNSVGDGLDSNGNITVTGGYIVVDGPEDSMNGALDSGTESGGKILISGGLLFAGGASGMAETFESESEQASVKCILPGEYAAGTVIKVSDALGGVLFEHEVQSRGNCIVFSCPEMKTDGTYIITIGDNDNTITKTCISSQFSISADGTVTEGSGGGSGGGERPEGESEGGERPEGESEGGERPEGDSEEGQRPEGESAEGQMPEGESAEGPAPGENPDEGQATEAEISD